MLWTTGQGGAAAPVSSDEAPTRPAPPSAGAALPAVRFDSPGSAGTSDRWQPDPRTADTTARALRAVVDVRTQTLTVFRGQQLVTRYPISTAARGVGNREASYRTPLGRHRVHQKFGADAFVADLVSLSLTRELAPLMTAIVVAGRSGAAIAAEIGTMKVSEEVDALRTLGICPHRFLVFPRMFALLLVLPLLTLAGDLVGILSGALVATSTLEIGLRKFLMSTQEALVPADILGGMLKASVFGVFIAGIACERGLAARGGAEGVGRSTTSAVVSMLFWLVLLDALFAVFFNIWGIY